MNHLEQLTANRKQCDQLIKLGITSPAFLFWLEDLATTDQDRKDGKIKYEVCPVENPEPGPDCVPAWTKAELDSMIGPELTKPDLFTKDQLGSLKMQKAESYPIHYIETMKVFFNGAEASADALIYLIENGHIKAADAVYRHSKIFKP